jgi:predicted dehydrogenase
MRTPPDDLRDFCVAVVGYGSIGRRHSENLAKLGVGRRILIRRRDAPNRAFLAPDDAMVVHSIRESIEAGADLAIICNPSSLHLSAAREYLIANVPVLIEKPLASRLAEAESFVSESEASGGTAGIAYCMRYHPAYALARQLVNEGSLRNVHRVKVWFESYLPDWHPWEDYRQSYAARAILGGGVLPTLDHEIDFVLWCFGAPERCSGSSWRSGKLDIDVDDSARIELNYGEHTVEVVLSFCQPARRRGFEFVCGDGTLRFNMEDQRLEIVNQAGAVCDVLWHEPDFDFNQIYLAMLRDALEGLASRRRLPIGLRAGLDALRVAATVVVERNEFRLKRGTE